MYLYSVDIPCSALLPTLVTLALLTAFPLLPLCCGGTITSSNAASNKDSSGNPLSVERVVARFTATSPIENLLLFNATPTASPTSSAAVPQKLVLGAVNRLYSLNPATLQVLDEVEVGPVLDSPLCDAELTSCIDNRASLREWDNHNKVLHYVGRNAKANGGGANGVLLVCGSVRQGTCQLRDADALGRQVRHPNFPAHFRHQPVAANAPNASTISLLSSDRERLYVAASGHGQPGHDSPYRGDFPAVATRLAPAGLLPINAGSIEGEAAVYIRTEYRQRFNVDYVGGFLDEKHVYWASVQPRHVQAPSATNPLVSKLIRVCREDERYVSYSEIELQCRSADDNTNFNVVRALKLLHRDLVVLFSDTEGRDSAICVYSMSKVRTTFWYNIDRCRAGTDSVGLPHIGRDAKCTNKSHMPLSEDTCQLGVGGAIEASQVASFQYSGHLLTAVDAASVEGKSLIVVGTSQGSILQFELSGEHNNRRLQKYSEYRVTISDAATISKVQMVDDSRFLAVADKEILLVRLSLCGADNTARNEPPSSPDPLSSSSTTSSCESCIANGDVLCGWCLGSGSCMRRSECRQGQTLLTEVCPKLAGQLEPANVSVMVESVPTHSKVLVPMSGLPRLPTSTSYECYFGLYKSLSAEWSPKGVVCQLPKQRPRIGGPAGTGDGGGRDAINTTDSLRVPLTLRVAGSRTNLLSTNFTFYDCSAHTVCSGCSKSQWPCAWCAAEHKCLNSETGQCAGKAIGADGNGGSPRCPRIDLESTPEILIADSTNASLTFAVLSMEAYYRKERKEPSPLHCEIGGSSAAQVDGPSVGSKEMGQMPIKLAAKLISPIRVQCASTFFNYTASHPLANSTLTLLAGEEVIDRTAVTIYKCSLMASDCSKCLSLDPKWHCTWCDGACRYHSHCSNKDAAVGDGSPAANQANEQVCTQAVIESFHPLSGPVEGGTMLEIRGRDLGSRLADVQDRVLVAGSKCQVVDYEVSTLIRCITTKSASAVTTSGPIRITIGQVGRRSVESKLPYRYVDPQPKSIYPAFGPQAGGTRLAIYGENLRSGRNVTVHLDNLSCEVESNSAEADDRVGGAERKISEDDGIVCITSGSPRTYTTTSIRVQIDGAVRLLQGGKFTYRPDPIVTSLHPSSAYEGGGRPLAVDGKNFDSLLTARMYLLSTAVGGGNGAQSDMEIVSELGQCQIVNATTMSCLSPKLSLPPERAERTNYGRWPVGFLMDGVAGVRNLGRRLQLATVPNPQFQPFTGVKVHPIDQPLLVHGVHLSQAAELTDYKITIGQEECRVFALDSTQLLCHPPTEREPAATDERGVELPGGHPLVVVRVGGVHAEIGPIELVGYSGTLVFGVRIGAMKLALLVVAALASILFVCALLLWLWRRRGSEHERVYKRIQLQMEQMESSVRNECKQAFAELQTDVMSEVNAVNIEYDACHPVIPFHERGEFTARLLFPPDGPCPPICSSDSLSHSNGSSADGRCGQRPPSCCCNGCLYSSSFLDRHSQQRNRPCDRGCTDCNNACGGCSSNSMPMAVAQFEQLLHDRQFVFLLVEMVEADGAVTPRERSTISSLLMAALHRRPVYLAEVVLALLSTHIERAIANKTSHLLFRNSDSLVEKLFQQWLSMCLHPYLVDPSGPGRPLYLLYKAIKYQIERGPVDCVTGECRYSLSEQKLLRDSSVDAKPVALLVMPAECFEQVPVVCRVLDCDSISQVKAKLLDQLYRGQPYSQRLHHEQFDLEWRCPKRGSVILMDDDQPAAKGLKRLNTVGYYQLANNSLLAMQMRSSPPAFPTLRSGSSDTTYSAWSSAHLIVESSSGSSPQSSNGSGGCGPTSSGDTHYFHLSPPSASNRSLPGNGLQELKFRHESTTLEGPAHYAIKVLRSGLNGNEGKQRGGGSPTNSTLLSSQPIVDRGTKNIPEIYLTRLLMCKGSIQRFVETFFDAVTLSDSEDNAWTTDPSTTGMGVRGNGEGGGVPIVLKFVFDLLDAEAARSGGSVDPDQLHAWKTNLLVLRFWVQLLHNPDSLFDVQRQSHLLPSLTVIAQTMVDVFSRSELVLGKESPSSKLLFAKEISRYRPAAERAFRRIAEHRPAVGHQQFLDYIATSAGPAESGHTNCQGPSKTAAVTELLNWSKANGLSLVGLLEQDPIAVNRRLGERFRQAVHCSLMEYEHVYATLR